MKKLHPAKMPLPRFRSDRETADYFQTHSVAEAWDQLPEAKPAKPSKTLEKSIGERHAGAKSPISIRLGPEQIAAAKKIAATKSVGYQTQLRMWIAEGIRREAKRAQLAISRARNGTTPG
jgi:predicted DNA binding CopG/RHH family protein